MKIVRDYTEEYKATPITITSAEYIGNYKISITFNNSTKQTVSFKNFLQKSMHPAINKYIDEKQFTNFKIVNGNINWNNYDLIFPVEDLYKGKI